MRVRMSYSKEERARLLEEGNKLKGGKPAMSAHQVADELRVPRTTYHRWLHPSAKSSGGQDVKYLRLEVLKLKEVVADQVTETARLKASLEAVLTAVSAALRSLQ